MKNGKRGLILFAILIVTALSCALMFSCNIDDVKEISITPDEINVRIGEFDYADYTVTATYDSGKTEEVRLSADMISASDRLKFYKEGEYEIAVTYMDCTATLAVKVRRNVFAGATFEDLDVVYNGECYTVEVKNLPEGTTVTYPSTNRFRNAGEYQATAILRKDAYEMKEMTAKVVIRKADYDLSQAVFADKTEVYDGTSHVLAMEGTLPAGLYVDYTITREGGREDKGNAAQNAGVYEVEATFTGDFNNYNAIDPLHATLTISQAQVDVSAVLFEDKAVDYDRTMQRLEIEGTLPLGVTVSYFNNEHVDAGAYEATAIFSVDDTVNYAAIPDKKATLTIRKAEYDMSEVQFNGIKVVYDGTEKRIEVQGQIPNGISVSYQGNVGTDAGSYKATALFSSGNVNYNDPAAMTATMIIDPAPAPMDQITFERRRFISQKSTRNQWSQAEWDEILSDPENNRYLAAVYYYDPYLAAKEYVPQNVPKGLEIASVKYKETAGWVDDLSAYDGEGDSYVGRDGLDHDGYYVVVVTFDGGKNYTGVSQIKTLIRVDTIGSLSNLKDMVYDATWVNPETKEATGAFMKAYIGACVPSEDLGSVTYGDVTVQYCNCNVFRDYALGGADALKSDRESYVIESLMAKFQELADSYVDFIGNVEFGYDDLTSSYVYTLKDKPENGESPSFRAFLKKVLMTTGLDYNDAEDDEEDDEFLYPFDVSKAAYIPLDDAADLVAVTNYDGGKTIDDYYTLLAQLFGFENFVDFFGADKVTGSVFDACLKDAFRTDLGISADSMTGRLACEGAIYQECGEDVVYVFPYGIWWIDAVDANFNTHYEYLYVICSEIGGVKHCGAVLSDAEALFGWLSDTEAYFGTLDEDEERFALMLDGRCARWEAPLYNLSPITKVVTENDTEVERAITGGKDFVFIEDGKATENLIHGDRDVYKFIADLPGNCAEQQEGYDESDYLLETEQAVYGYCECDPFASVIKAGGVASEIAKKEERADHSQMASEIVEKFDSLSALYHAFLLNYVNGEDVVNEWKIGASNRNYNAYKSFFEYASDMMAKSNRNMGKNNEYVLSKSVIIGMNRSFTISVNGSGNDYTLDQYRLIVAKLFGFADLDALTAYTDALARALAANAKNANVESVPARLLYDGAVLTTNGSYVLPFAIKSETSTRNVLAFVFVGADGTMSIWINDARNAFNATNFGEEELDSSDKYVVTINGRCMMFEDDGYIMKEDLSKSVLDMIDNLQNFANNTFLQEDNPENCGASNRYWEIDQSYDEDEEDESSFESDLEWDYDPYRTWTDDAVYYYCDCDPLSCRVKSHTAEDAIANRNARGDYAEMEQSVVARFDALSALYGVFFSRYDLDEIGADGKIIVGKEDYQAYRRLFRYAKDFFASANGGLGEVGDYLLSDSVIVGMNKAFAISSVGGDRTVEEYRMMVAKLFGFKDIDTFNEYTEALAAALVANARNAGVDTVADRLIYDGAVLTTNGCYVFPYTITNIKSAEKVLAFVFVDADGTMAIWIHNAESAFTAISFTPLTEENNSHEAVFINGRCSLFEQGDYTGLLLNQKTHYVAVEKIKTFQSAGNFLIYSPFTDEEGFEVYWFSVYGYELEVIYEDPDSDAIGTVHKGFYTLIGVASSDDVQVANRRLIAEAEAQGEEWV